LLGGIVAPWDAAIGRKSVPAGKLGSSGGTDRQKQPTLPARARCCADIHQFRKHYLRLGKTGRSLPAARLVHCASQGGFSAPRGTFTGPPLEREKTKFGNSFVFPEFGKQQRGPGGTPGVGGGAMARFRRFFGGLLLGKMEGANRRRRVFTGPE